MKFDSFKEEVQSKFKFIDSDKLKIQEFIVYKEEIAKEKNESKESLDNFKELTWTSFENIKKTIIKIENKFQNYAEKDDYYEIKSRINDLAHKDLIKELEDKMMPMMLNIVKKTQNFDDSISDCRDKCNRIDELLLDKCSK